MTLFRFIMSHIISISFTGQKFHALKVDCCYPTEEPLLEGRTLGRDMVSGPRPWVNNRDE